MRKLLAILPLLAGLGAMAALMLCPETAAESARWGLRLCFEMLIPSLLPFLLGSLPGSSFLIALVSTASQREHLRVS